MYSRIFTKRSSNSVARGVNIIIPQRGIVGLTGATGSRGIMTPGLRSGYTKGVNIKLVNSMIKTIRMNSSKSSSDTEIMRKPDLTPKGPGKLDTSDKSKPNKEVEQKKTVWEKVKHEAAHYWLGTKLLGYEVKVSTKLIVKLFSGYALSRREANQLQRTLTDLVRLVPFAALVLIPFAELLIPVIVRIFPNFLPSTYESSKARKAKSAKLNKSKDTASMYIKKTIEESGLKLSKFNDEEREAFVSFFDTISMGKTPTREHLIRVARLFKNDQVLDNLSRPQLLAMSKYMNITPFGTDSILRYQIRHRLLNIIKDDKAIDYEGIESLTIPELKYACQQRGIQTSQVSPGRLREDLATWLDLRLRQKIPSSLLILSSTYTYGDHAHDLETYYDALLAVLSSIPDEVYNVAKLELSDDSKLKLDILKEQDELINEENMREKDTVTKVQDDIKLDELEETSEEGMTVEPDSETSETEHVKKTETEKEKETKKEGKDNQPPSASA